jgi:WD40 repeat protein
MPRKKYLLGEQKFAIMPRVNINLCSVSDEFMACIWDAATGTLLKTLTDHKGEIYGLTMSPDAKYYVTTSMDGWLYIYSANVSSLDPWDSFD